MATSKNPERVCAIVLIVSLLASAGLVHVKANGGKSTGQTMGLRRLGRGASLPANPCSFVRKHHVYRAGWASGGWNVVLHCPQTLVPSSGGTTSFSSRGAGRDGAWCFTTRKPLFLRPETPRLSGRMGLRRRRRGASPPASPYSFVRKHHVCQSGWDEVGNGTAVSLPLHT